MPALIRVRKNDSSLLDGSEVVPEQSGPQYLLTSVSLTHKMVEQRRFVSWRIADAFPFEGLEIPSSLLYEIVSRGLGLADLGKFSVDLAMTVLDRVS